jgi:hypothetical protein
MSVNRRTFLLSGFAFAAFSGTALAAKPVFYRTPGCGCCHAWTERMAAAGLPVTLEDTDDLSAVSAKFGVPSELQGCHVGQIGGYVVSGHVPPEDIQRLLSERPQALGLTVPGMPIGSPGMEMDGQTERYEVLLMVAEGGTKVFAVHGAG